MQRFALLDCEHMIQSPNIFFCVGWEEVEGRLRKRAMWLSNRNVIEALKKNKRKETSKVNAKHRQEEQL